MRADRVSLAIVLVALLVSLATCGTSDVERGASGGATVPTEEVAPSVSPPADTTATNEATAPLATLSPVIENATTDPTSVSIDPTPGIAADAACDARISETFIVFETFDELAWFSHHVVVGTIVERLPSQKAMVEGSALPFTIVTDVIVEVEH